VTEHAAYQETVVLHHLLLYSRQDIGYIADAIKGNPKSVYGKTRHEKLIGGNL